jgi:hypothetical protein
VLPVAIAVCIVAVLAGLVAAVRSAVRLSRRLARLEELAPSGKALIAQVHELAVRAARIRAESERLRALADLLP